MKGAHRAAGGLGEELLDVTQITWRLRAALAPPPQLWSYSGTCFSHQPSQSFVPEHALQGHLEGQHQPQWGSPGCVLGEFLRSPLSHPVTLV